LIKGPAPDLNPSFQSATKAIERAKQNWFARTAHFQLPLITALDAYRACAAKRTLLAEIASAYEKIVRITQRSHSADNG
jgi:hypothetical protein